MPVYAGKSRPIPCVLCGSPENRINTEKDFSLSFKEALVCEGFSFVRCKRCALVQRNPQPDKKEIIARYSDTFGKDYLAYELANENSFLKLQQLALKDVKFEFDADKFMQKYQEQRKDISAEGESATLPTAPTAPAEPTVPAVLDIGCATGALLAHLREHGWRVTGVEISPCADFAKNERSLDVRNLPLEENNFLSGSFHAVLASHLIEHLNDPKTFLSEINRILKDEGQIFITTPNISGFQARLFGSRWRSAIFDHLYLFSKSTLSKLLKDTGFTVESCRTWGGLAAGSFSGIAEGRTPKWLKKTADYLAKRFNCGDVMIIRAKKLTRPICYTDMQCRYLKADV